MAEFSLGEFMIGFMQYAKERGVKSFPSFNNKLWHLWLYQSKEDLGQQFPEFALCIGRFDWDGPYPTSPRLKKIQVGFLVSWFATERFSDDRLIIITDMPKSTLLHTYSDLFAQAFEMANQYAGFFEIS